MGIRHGDMAKQPPRKAPEGDRVHVPVTWRAAHVRPRWVGSGWGGGNGLGAGGSTMGMGNRQRGGASDGEGGGHVGQLARHLWGHSIITRHLVGRSPRTPPYFNCAIMHMIIPVPAISLPPPTPNPKRV
ncbi:hypothetical protein NL676_010344 [Syzygium grande]|nr:hypothetical protein NL676_010344 [Syzygium grande]